MLQLGFNIKCCIANIYDSFHFVFFLFSISLIILLSSYVIIYNQLKGVSAIIGFPDTYPLHNDFTD